MERLIAAIYDFEPVPSLRNLLQRHSLEFLFRPDTDGLDILHHAILANNPEILPLLQEKGFGLSLPPENGSKPETVGYLHLASLVSNTIVLGALCDLPNSCVSIGCSRKCWPDLEVIKTCMQRGQNRVTSPEKLKTCTAVYGSITDSGDEGLVLPVDIAAMSQNLMGVQMLLAASNTNASSKKLSILQQAAEANSLIAFRFLLSQGPKQLELESALKYCLSRKLVGYLKELLDCGGVDVKRALNSVNPFHVVYLCSTSFRQPGIRNPDELSRRNRCLAEVTSCLIDRGFDVNARLPICTYPLYSLITALVHEKDNNPTRVPVYHIEALEVMLRAGADGNFDEARYLQETASEDIGLSGRDASTSVLNCYFICLQSCDTWRPHIMEHLDRLCLMLLENGADADYVDAYGRAPLHDLMQAMASQHATGHMHADLSTMSRMLLYFGADPNRRSAEEGEYPVELYFTKILAVMGGLFAFRRWKESNNIPQVLNLLYFMNSDDANAAYRSILASLVNAKTDGMPDEVLNEISELMNDYIYRVKSLEELARLALWKAASRKIEKLRQLRMPKAFLSSIKHLFALDI